MKRTLWLTFTLVDDQIKSFDEVFFGGWQGRAWSVQNNLERHDKSWEFMRPDITFEVTFLSIQHSILGIRRRLGSISGPGQAGRRNPILVRRRLGSIFGLGQVGRRNPTLIRRRLGSISWPNQAGWRNPTLIKRRLGSISGPCQAGRRNLTLIRRRLGSISGPGQAGRRNPTLLGGGWVRFLGRVRPGGEIQH